MNDNYDEVDFHHEVLQFELEEMNAESLYNNSVFYSPKIDFDFPS